MGEQAYTFGEVEAVLATHRMDIYHRELMRWLLAEAKGAEQRIWQEASRIAEGEIDVHVRGDVLAHCLAEQFARKAKGVGV